MTPEPQTRKVILIAIDGFGVAIPGAGNAITPESAPTIHKLMVSYPHTLLGASGESVGLPRGEDGNSETGHVNLGAGRIVYQYLARINMSIADGTFFVNPALVGAMEHAVVHNSALHLMGLVGSGGVHSNVEHLYALIRMAAKHKVNKLFVHVFTDGRDSPPNISRTYIAQINEVMQREGIGRIASVMGRYFAMDRDRRWDRTAKAYLALVNGEGHLVKTAQEAIAMSYERGATDEFVEPSLVSENGQPIGKICDNDAVIFYNFRIDRPRQLSRAFVLPSLDHGGREWGFDPYLEIYGGKQSDTKQVETPLFNRGDKLKNLYFGIMTEYEKPLVDSGAKAAYPPEVIQMPLGRVLSENNMRQLRIAESEKERFVTFYFNGRREVPFAGEERVIIQSPKVATYDLKPEMATFEITKALIDRLEHDEYDFVFMNFAAPDMVAHTGNIEAAKKAVKAVDDCIGVIYKYILSHGWTMMITADHGNVEEMIDLQTGEIDTEHSINDVPFLVVSKEYAGRTQTLPKGVLGDVAVTVLKYLNIDVPNSMMGTNLLADVVRI